MSKILLIHPASNNAAKGTMIWPPLGLCRIATYLEQHGHTVRIIEDSLHHYDGDELEATMLAENPDFIGIGAMTLQMDRVAHIVEIIRRLPTSPVVVAGGAHFSAIDELPSGFDYMIRGDGEKAFLEIIEATSRCETIESHLKGTPVDYYIPVDFKWIDYPKYGDHLIDGTRAISIMSARGCPFGCKFCGSPKFFGRRVVHYPIDEVVLNIVQLSTRYGIKAIRVMDDTFTVNSERVQEFCRAIKPFNFRLSCLTHVNTVREKDLDAMKVAGFEFIAIGIESADMTVLDKTGKAITPDKAAQAVQMIHKAGMKVEALFMIGLPGETTVSLQKSISFARALGADRTHAQFFTPFPGCAYHDEIEHHGVMLKWRYEDFTHRKPVFLPNTITYKDFMEGAEEFFTLCGRKIQE